MEINFFREDVACPGIDQDKYKNWILKVIDTHGKKCGDITFIFTSDEYLYKMNSKYLNHHYYTDVITFDYSKNDILSGDIFISIDRVKENADRYEVTFINELSRVIIHGVLHLAGFKDNTSEEKEKMREEEDKALRLLA